MVTVERMTEWEDGLDWTEVGPKFLAALEDIDCILHICARGTRLNGRRERRSDRA
jgi:hypothetical protein